MPYGTVQEWTIEASTIHPFHLHVFHMQVRQGVPTLSAASGGTLVGGECRLLSVASGGTLVGIEWQP